MSYPETLPGMPPGWRLDPYTAPQTWRALVEMAALLGYTVQLVEYCECAETPGFLGMALGTVARGSKIIRVRAYLPEVWRCWVLAHELDHIQHPDDTERIDGRDQGIAATAPRPGVVYHDRQALRRRLRERARG
jgi:hypothetical protein